jgi:enoyl-CoA hydratase
VREVALEVAVKLASGSRSALAFTKRALNNWLRLAGPSFDTSLALEFLGFRLGDAREGLDAVRKRRPPGFDRR